MTRSVEYNTQAMYSVAEKDGMSFIDKHMRYMSQYPNLNHRQYIQNLKLMTRIKESK